MIPFSMEHNYDFSESSEAERIADSPVNAALRTATKYATFLAHPAVEMSQFQRNAQSMQNSAPTQGADYLKNVLTLAANYKRGLLAVRKELCALADEADYVPRERELDLQVKYVDRILFQLAQIHKYAGKSFEPREIKNQDAISANSSQKLAFREEREHSTPEVFFGLQAELKFMSDRGGWALIPDLRVFESKCALCHECLSVPLRVGNQEISLSRYVSAFRELAAKGTLRSFDVFAANAIAVHFCHIYPEHVLAFRDEMLVKTTYLTRQQTADSVLLYIFVALHGKVVREPVCLIPVPFHCGKALLPRVVFKEQECADFVAVEFACDAALRLARCFLRCVRGICLTGC